MARRKPQVCKVDDNQPAIVRALRAHDFPVQPLSAVMGGCPDLLVCCGVLNVLFEVKMPGETLNERQVKWHREWPGLKVVVTTPGDAVSRAIDFSMTSHFLTARVAT